MAKDGNSCTLLDFGFSFCTDELKEKETKKTQFQFCGTPSYMAPEIIKKSQDRQGFKQADIWALGVVFYALLTGKFPFKGSSSKEIFKESVFGNYPALPKGVS